MYEAAKALGVTLMTVSHRRSLWRHHGWILQFDGQGGYAFGELDAERRLRLEGEREELEGKLRGVEEMERRVRELEGGRVGAVSGGGGGGGEGEGSGEDGSGSL